MRGLIGYTGFVGSNLHEQTRFDDLYNSRNIEDIRGREYDLLVCSGVSAVKWWANKYPEQDEASIGMLLDNLRHARAEKLVLISTVDVYPCLNGVDEMWQIDRAKLHTYGANRLAFEQEVTNLFESVHVVRLPALFGLGLKKNILYDLICKNMLESINLDSMFQWYPVSRLWSDIEQVMKCNIPLVNFAVQPIATRDIVSRWFSELVVGDSAAAVAYYDVHTDHASSLGGQGRYILSRDSVMEELDLWLKEPGVHCA